MSKENNYENVPISDKTEKGMTLTSDDRQYLQRMFALQDEYTKEFIKKTYDEHAEIICGVVRDMIAEQNEAMSKKFDEVNKSIREIKADIADIKKDIQNIKGDMREMEIEVAILKKYSSFASTFSRVVIGIVIGVSIALGLGFLFFK